MEAITFSLIQKIVEK